MCCSISSRVTTWLGWYSKNSSSANSFGVRSMGRPSRSTRPALIPEGRVWGARDIRLLPAPELLDHPGQRQLCGDHTQDDAAAAKRGKEAEMLSGQEAE